MADKEKPIKLVTPQGTAMYPYLNKPDFGNERFKKPDGEYGLQLRMTVAEGQEVIDTLDSLADATFDAAVKENGGKKFKIVKGKKKELERNKPYVLEVDEEGKETGNVIFRFTMKANYKDAKTGEVRQNTPKLFDAAGGPLGKTAVWGGSLVKVAATLRPYGGELGYGVKCYLNAVQVIKLQSGGGGDASSFGFGKEEGYVSEASSEGFSDESSSGGGDDSSDDF